ncbi:MAG: putative membrane protein [Maribacter sp.]|jgi:putative membrane protein
MLKTLKKNQLTVSIAIIWLFHISAMIGVALGEVDWFVEKTPLNLIISLLIFLVFFPIDTFKKSIAFLIFFAGGIFAEWLGVTYQMLFGEYAYGSNFGPKLDGVPYLIGAYWAILTFITASIMDYTKWHTVTKVIGAAGLMVLLDFLMEHTAPIFDYWTFAGGIPTMENYVTWFALGIAFQLIVKLLGITGNKLLSVHLYLAQFIFFLFFYFLFP